MSQLTRRPSMLISATAVAIFLLCAVQSQASAQEISAMVSEKTGGDPRLTQDEVLSVGQSFDLGPAGSVVLAYLESCILETIKGGHFTVGKNQSRVTGGIVNRAKFPCANGPISAGPNGESGGAYSRDPFANLTIGSTQPILLAPDIGHGQPARFKIQRLDTAAKPLELDCTGPALDLMRLQIALALGGRYKIDAAGHTAIFRITANPPAGGVSTFSRIVVVQ